MIFFVHFNNVHNNYSLRRLLGSREISKTLINDRCPKLFVFRETSFKFQLQYFYDFEHDKNHASG